MSNDLVKQARSAGGLAAMTQQMLANIDDSTEQLMNETGATNGSFLQFSGKTGEYKLNGQPIANGTQFAFSFLHMQKGVICWRDNKPIKRDVVPVLSGQPIPEPPVQPIQGDKWNTLLELPVRCLDDGLQASFGLSTTTGTRALTRVFAEWGQKVRMHMDTDGSPMVCIVEVSSKRISFKDKEKPDETIYTFVPEFKIVEWASAADFNFAPEPGEGEDPAEDDGEGEPQDDNGVEDAEIVEEGEVEEVVEEAPPQKAAPARRPAAAPAAAKPAAAKPAAATRPAAAKPAAAAPARPAGAPTRPATGFGAGVRGRRV
jgi:hypothetical protein